VCIVEYGARETTVGSAKVNSRCAANWTSGAGAL